MKVIEPIWTTKPETAGRVRGRIESILDWAKVKGHRQGDNPAAWRGHLSELLPAQSKVRKVAHRPSLPYAELGAFMKALRAREGTAARALEFAIATAARTGEVIGARWVEIDRAAGVWTVPAERMKMQREHRFDLTVHGFRSTFKTWATECTEHPREAIEISLAHAVGDAVEQAYLRGDLLDKRRKLMDDWAAYCG